MASRSGKRDTLLKTYGKRSASIAKIPEGPPTKRRCTAENAQDDTRVDRLPDSEVDSVPSMTFSSSPAAMSEPKRAKTASEAKLQKSSILCYFQPIPIDMPSKPAKTIEVAILEDDHCQLESSPTYDRRRKTRLLRVRSAPSSNGPTEPTTGIATTKTATLEPTLRRSRYKRPLQDVNGNTTKQSSTRPKDNLEPTRNLQPKSKAAVQMTLNISMTPAFSDCRLCDMIWNPLYPDDVKFHERRHRLALRKQRKEELDKL